MKTCIWILLSWLCSRLVGYGQRLEVLLPPDVSGAATVHVRTYQQGIKANVESMHKGSGTHSYWYDFAGRNGYYELLVDGYSPLPFIVHGQSELIVKPTIDQLKGFTVAGSDAENQALAYFLAYYTQHSVRLSQVKKILEADRARGDTAALTHFVEGFAAYQADQQTDMETLHGQYPHTYVGKFLTGLYQVSVPMGSSSEAAIDHIRHHFFDNWDLTQPLLLSNPFSMSQLDTYYSCFWEKDDGLYPGLDALLTRSGGASKLLMTESLIDMVSRVLLKNHHPHAEDYALYMAETYGQGCELPSTPVNRHATIPERIQRMQAGAQFPDLHLQVFGQASRMSLKDQWARQPYTLLFFWQSNCPHCLSAMPELEQVAIENAQHLHTVAVAIDRHKEELENYLKLGKQSGHDHTHAWTDCWEPGEPANEQLAQIHLKTTPCFVLLNQQGRVVITTQSVATIKRNINK